MRVLNVVFILAMTLCYSRGAAQANVALSNMPLSIKIVSLCEKITSVDNNPYFLMNCFWGSTIMPNTSNNYSQEFKELTIYSFGKDSSGTFILNRLNNKTNILDSLNEIIITINARYYFSNEQKSIKYDISQIYHMKN